MWDIINEIPTFAPWAKVLVVIGLCLIIFAASFGRVKSTLEPKTENEPIAQPMKQEVSGVGRDAYNFQGSTVTIVQTPQDNRSIKVKIRDYLRTINPKIIDALDSGQPSICVMINSANLPTLFELQKDSDFKAYLEAQSTGSVILGGSNNSIGGCLNDSNEIGQLNGFNLIFKERLQLDK